MPREGLHGEDLALAVDQKNSPGGPQVEEGGMDGWFPRVTEHWSRQALGGPGTGCGKGRVTFVCFRTKTIELS